MMKKTALAAMAFILLGAGCASGSAVTENGSASTAPPASSSGTAAPAAPRAANSFTPTAMPKTYAFPGVLPENQIAGRQIRVVTEKGIILFELFDKEAPKAVSNFVYLAKAGFYDGLAFHRVEPGFVIQGGDPNGNGTGGPGYVFEDEPVSRPYERGIVAMANRGPDTNGSQFFIMLEDAPLPPNYTIFGRVTKGMDVVDAIRVGDRMASVQVEKLGAP